MKSFKQLGMIMPTAIGSSSGGSSSGGSSSGGSSVPAKDVNFIDYDGTILHSYTAEEALALTALPKLPTREGLICQEWNWSLEDMQSYVADYGICEVGATYITDDGKTRLYVEVSTEVRTDVRLHITQSVANGIIVNWGDGSDDETISDTGSVGMKHTYADVGNFVITLEPVDGCAIGLSNGSLYYSILGSSKNKPSLYATMLRKVEIGNGVTSIGKYAFSYCYHLESVSIPNGVTTINEYAFQNIANIKGIVIPNGTQTICRNAFEYDDTLVDVSIPNSVTSIEKYAFNGDTSLMRIAIPNGITIIDDNVFTSCYSLPRISIPNSVTSINNNAFYRPYGMSIIDFTAFTTVPSLYSSQVFYEHYTPFEIRVPAALAEEWKAATNWSSFASYIVGV